MRVRLLLTVLGLAALLAWGPGNAPREARAANASGTHSIPSAPGTQGMLFVENAGQFDARARFQVYGAGVTLWLAGDALWITLVGPANTAAIGPIRGVNLRLSFVGANPQPRLEPFARQDATFSYFLGSDPAGWHPDVPVWGGVRYVGLYPGLDLEVTGGGGWTWRLVPELDAAERTALRDVRLRVEGAEGITLAGDHLKLRTAAGEYACPLLQLPETGAWGSAHPVLQGAEVSAPVIGVDGSTAVVLTEDIPALVYSTLIGGSKDERSNVWADAQGYAYVSGATTSWDFPATPGTFDPNFHGGVACSGWLCSDAYVLKLNPAGTSLVYATMLGGDGADSAAVIGADAAGNAWVYGSTKSDDFPTTPGAYDRTLGGGLCGGHGCNADLFVARLDASGSTLLFSTLVGGAYDEAPYGAAVDASGAVYVTGETISSDFPATPGALDTVFEGDDAFVTKLDPTGSALVYSTFLGGSAREYGTGIVVDDLGRAAVVGTTLSFDFPTKAGAYERIYHGEEETFVTRLNAQGSALCFSTLFGGSDVDYGDAIALDRRGGIVVAGTTSSDDLPVTPDAFQTYRRGTRDLYVAGFTADGSDLVYATLLGGGGDNAGAGLAVDEGGRLYVTGRTTATTFPTTIGAVSRDCGGGYDIVLAVLDNSARALLYGTYLGGVGNDFDGNVALDGAGNAYVAGRTQSYNFPTTEGAYDRDYQGYSEGFVVKLHLDPCRVWLPAAWR